jgi:pyridoxamine 5'-phosphate oxidase
VNLADLRKDYQLRGLRESDVDADPFRQFADWFEQARAAGVTEPNAMTLATCTRDGIPSARVVLLKGHSAEGGFTFFTSYDGRKARELADNPRAALLFYWADLERQIRIEGTVERTTAEESAEYFARRPRGSQLGAWASHQSAVIAGGRAELEAKLAEVTRRFDGGEVPCPPYWGGYRLRPAALEFWQGRPDRLHDRLRYRLDGGRWVIERLSP